MSRGPKPKHSQQPPGVVQNRSTLQCSKQNTEQCGYDHAPVTRGRMRAQFPLPHGPGFERYRVGGHRWHGANGAPFFLCMLLFHQTIHALSARLPRQGTIQMSCLHTPKPPDTHPPWRYACVSSESRVGPPTLGTPHPPLKPPIPPPPPPHPLADPPPPQGLALIFSPVGWGGGPPPPSAHVHPKTWVLGTFFSHGKKIFGAFSACHTLCTYCSMCAPSALFSRLPCPNALFRLPGPTVATRKTRRRN